MFAEEDNAASNEKEKDTFLDMCYTIYYFYHVYLVVSLYLFIERVTNPL